VAGQGESDLVYHCPPQCGPDYMMESPSLALARGSLCGQFLCLVGDEGLVTLSHLLGRGGNVLRPLHWPHDRQLVNCAKFSQIAPLFIVNPVIKISLWKNRPP